MERTIKEYGKMLVLKRPCPLCRRWDELTVEVHDSCYTVCCKRNSCINRYRGGYAGTPEDAVDMWNRGVSWEDR